ncbi:hypothetical protein B0H19DRAFT_1103618 [Mycena capillaripes]|nr:hypothetical protein B0H19DRAFT_1103618 [Mycena capillaripes]
MAGRVFKVGVIAPEGAEEIVANKLTTRVCDALDCKNHEDLHKCARCKTAMYCSKECQKADWSRHKPYCKMVTEFPPATDPDTGGEPPLQRHLRLWAARFNNSLVCAIIVALELNKHPKNIDNFGLVVTLHPRPHAEAGARFHLVSAVVMPMAELVVTFVDVPARPGHGSTLMQLHKEHRDELKARTKGMEDYATMVIVAMNKGPHALPGGLQTEIRFKPLGVHKKLIRSAQLNDPTLDWLTTLRNQVDGDHPNQTLVV